MSRYTDARVRRAVDTLSASGEVARVFRRRDLVAAGIDDTLITSMLKRHELLRLRHGVYVVRGAYERAGETERHRLDISAAVAAAQEPVWAYGASAALLLEMPLPFTSPDALQLVRASGADQRRLGQPSRHRLTIPRAQIVTGPVQPTNTLLAMGVPCVSPALAAVATASKLTSARWRTALMDAAMWHGATAEEIDVLIGVWRQLGHRHELTAALERARPGAQTVLETLSRLALMEQGLPEPILQQPFYDADGLIGYVDMWWKELNVIGEADGLIKYSARADLVAEKRREDRLRAKGHAVVRWTLADIEERPAEVAAAIRRASGWAS